MGRALDILKKAVSMKPQRKVVNLEDGSVFEYWTTPLTLAERQRAQKQSKSEDPSEFALILLVNKAKDENGSPLFTVGDLPELRNAMPASVVEQLMLQLLVNDEDEDEEELDMKSSQGTASSGRKSAG